MPTEFMFKALVGLLPVALFLFTLVYMDSYKLVSLKSVLSVIVLGGLVAFAALYVNGWLMGELEMEYRPYTRYAGPAVEELLKALVVVFLFRANRIGFLVDSAIMGFAVGTGFAMVENYFMLQSHGDAHLVVWVVRGFGTAIMHGGATAIFAITTHTIVGQNQTLGKAAYLPGYFIAVIVHSVFNHFFFAPIINTLAVLLTLPLPVSVALIADLDWGPVVAGYVAAMMLGGAYLAIGLFVSARTDSRWAASGSSVNSARRARE